MEHEAFFLINQKMIFYVVTPRKPPTLESLEVCHIWRARLFCYGGNKKERKRKKQFSHLIKSNGKPWNIGYMTKVIKVLYDKSVPLF